jgi:hypothetical protein
VPCKQAVAERLAARRQDCGIESSLEIDDLIVARKIIPAMQAIRSADQCGRREAIALFYERYELLRETRPGDFTMSREEYGEGVYT